ncbi:MAG: RNA 2',3'-cyclic phosphodiesterase [Rhodothermaceae bacterium]|nr:RNA 2',3'-cyclic phosphodiesterase [Rhodothermaceae bacterium]
MPPPPLRRLFLALDLPPDVTAALTAWRPPIPGARWLPEDHLHLTTRFLGPTDPERLAAITEVVRGLRSDPVPVTTGALLRLPSARRPRALAVAVDDSRALRAVVGRLDRRLAEVGVPGRDLAFLPHVTLARFRPPDPTVLRKALRGIDPPSASGVAASVSLVESLPDDTGAHYVTLLCVPLVETAPASGG